MPERLALDPQTLGETLGDIRTLAQATDARTRAMDLVAVAARVDRVRPRSGRAAPARVVASSGLTPCSSPATGRPS